MISIIVPYRNAEPWIGRCCESLQFAESDFEFLLIDDNSSDTSADIVADYAALDHRFVNLKNEEWPGVSGARNTGLNHAHGDWITFLDADDELNPEATKTFVDIFMKDRSANVYQFNHMRKYEDAPKPRIKYANPVGWYHIDALPNRWCMVWNKLFRRSFIEEHGIRFVEDLQYGEDELFILECLAKDDRIYCWSGVTVTKHFDNKESLSRTKTDEDLITVVNALAHFLLRQEDPNIRTAMCRIISQHWTSKTFLKLLGRKE